MEIILLLLVYLNHIDINQVLVLTRVSKYLNKSILRSDIIRIYLNHHESSFFNLRKIEQQSIITWISNGLDGKVIMSLDPELNFRKVMKNHINHNKRELILLASCALGFDNIVRNILFSIDNQCCFLKALKYHVFLTCGADEFYILKLLLKLKIHIDMLKEPLVYAVNRNNRWGNNIVSELLWYIVSETPYYYSTSKVTSFLNQLCDVAFQVNNAHCQKEIIYTVSMLNSLHTLVNDREDIK